MASELPPLEILLRFRPTGRRDLVAPALLGLVSVLGALAWTGDGMAAGVTTLALLALWRFATDLLRLRALFRGGAGEEILLAGWDPGQVAEGAGWLVARRVAVLVAAAAAPVTVVGLLHGEALALGALLFPWAAGGVALVVTVMTVLHQQQVALVTVETGGAPAHFEEAIEPLRRRVLASRLAAQPLMYRTLAVALSPTRWRVHLPALESLAVVAGLLLLVPWLQAGDLERLVVVALGAALLMLWRSAARVLRTEGDLHSLRMREVLLSTGLSQRALSSGAVGAALAPGLGEALLLAAGLLAVTPDLAPVAQLALLNVVLAPVAGALAAGATGAGRDRSREVTVLNAVLPTVFAWLVGLSLYQPAIAALGMEPDAEWAPVGSLALALLLTAGLSLRRLGQDAHAESRRAAVLVALPLLVGGLVSLDLATLVTQVASRPWLGYHLPAMGVLSATGLAVFLMARWCLGPLVLRLATSPPSPALAMLVGAALGRAGAWVVGTAQVPWHLGLVTPAMAQVGPLPPNAEAGLLPVLAGALAAAVVQGRWRLEGPALPTRVDALAMRLAGSALALGLGLHLVATAGLPTPTPPAVPPFTPADDATSAAELQWTMQKVLGAATRSHADVLGLETWKNQQRLRELRTRMRAEADQVEVGVLEPESLFWTVPPGELAVDMWRLDQDDLGAELLILSLDLQEKALGFGPGQDLAALREPEGWLEVRVALAQGIVSEPAALRRLVRDLPDGSVGRARLLRTLDEERARVARGAESEAEGVLGPPMPGPLRQALLERDRRQAGANLALAARMMPALLASDRASLRKEFEASLRTPASRPLNGWGLVATVEAWHDYRERIEELRVMAALHLFEREQGRYAERLEDLVPGYLPALPANAAAFLRYARPESPEP